MNKQRPKAMETDEPKKRTYLQRMWDSLRSVTCEDCGEAVLPEDWEREPIGTGLEAYRCPNCGELTAYPVLGRDS